VELLLKAGVKPNEKDHEHGFTALHEAVSTGNTDAVKALLAFGADMEATDGMLKRTPLTLAKKKNKDEIVKLLEEAVK